ncbi:hypothetical protein ACN42_g11582 [Penicillium freii]|uniref:Uncharacterized protein n=1 Tax=Penicillium freii TaxID=48697 RepID=A0A101M7W9_PENFR|nr:hypothetical protein ACN42_g11582 [Penicillium freii]
MSAQVTIRACSGAQGRAQLYSVSKKRQGLSTKTERERQEVAEVIWYVGTDHGVRYTASSTAIIFSASRMVPSPIPNPRVSNRVRYKPLTPA